MTASGDTPAEISTKLTENCELVSNWMQGNKLELNAGKTHLMTVGTGARLRIQTLLSGWKGVILEDSAEKFEGAQADTGAHS